MRVILLVVGFSIIYAVKSADHQSDNRYHYINEKSHHENEKNSHYSGRHHHSTDVRHHSAGEIHHYNTAERHHHGTEERHHHNTDERHHHTDERHHHNTDERHHHNTAERHHQSDRHHHSTADRHHHGTAERLHHNPAQTHHYSPAERHHIHSSFYHPGYRANENNQHCSWTCVSVLPTSSPAPPTELGFQIVYNSSSSIFAIQSKPSKLVLVIDYGSNIFLLLNGQTGVTIIFEVASQQVIRITQSPQTEAAIWNPGKSSLEEYLQKTSVQDILKIGQQYGQKSQVTSLPEIVTKEVDDALKNFGIPSLSSENLQLLTTFSKYLKDILSVLYRGSGTFNVQGNLRWFLKINVLLAELLNPANSGIDLSKINVNLRNVFNGTSGIETIINLFSQIGRQVNLSKIIGSIFSSRERILKFLTDASSGSHNGLDGLITILVNIANLLNGQGSFSEVINSILKYNSTSEDEPTFGQVINQGLELLKTQNSSFPGGQNLTEAIQFLQALNNHSFVLNNVNIWDIIKIFFTPNPLDRISLIYKVSSSFSPQKAIPEFFKYVTELFNGTQNTGLISRLIPGLNISQFTGNGSILQNIFQGRNLTQLLSGGGNVTSVLSQIPVFGPIASRLASFFQQRGESLEQYLNPSSLQGLFSNFTSGSGLGQVFDEITNSTQGANGIGGFVSGLQNSIGSIFGVGNNPEQSQTQSPPSASVSAGFEGSASASVGAEESTGQNSASTTSIIPGLANLFGGSGSSAGSAPPSGSNQSSASTTSSISGLANLFVGNGSSAGSVTPSGPTPASQIVPSSLNETGSISAGASTELSISKQTASGKDDKSGSPASVSSESSTSKQTASSVEDKNSSPPASVNSENPPIANGGSFNPFGLRGYIAGSLSGGFGLENRNKRKYLHN